MTMVMPESLSSWNKPMISMLVRRVEIAGRFVGQHQFGLVDQGAGDGDALLLAAGKLAGMMAEPVAEADFLQRLHGALVACRASGISGWL